jgi:hypothetical protein
MHRFICYAFLTLAAVAGGCSKSTNTVEIPENPAPPPAVESLSVPTDGQAEVDASTPGS